MTGEIIYLREEKPNIFKLFTLGLRRILKIVVNPFTAFEEIHVYPDIFGPLILFILVIFSSIFSEYFFRSHIVIEYVDNCTLLKNATISFLGNIVNISYAEGGNIVSIDKMSEIYIQNIHFLFTFRLMHYGLTWISMYLIFLSICSLLKAYTKDIFKSIGYLLSINLLENLVKIMYIFHILTTFSQINIVIAKSETNMSEILTESIVFFSNFYLSTHSQLKWIIGGVNWFLALWGIVMSIAFLNSYSKLGVVRSIVGGTIAYIIIKMLVRILLPPPII